MLGHNTYSGFWDICYVNLCAFVVSWQKIKVCKESWMCQDHLPHAKVLGNEIKQHLAYHDKK